MTKEILNPNSQLLLHHLGLRASTFFRHSCLVIRHSDICSVTLSRGNVAAPVYFATLKVRCSISSVLRSSNLYLRRNSSVMLIPSPGAVTG